MNKQKGFILIELLAVIVIIGLLVTLVMAAYRQALCKDGNIEMCKKIGIKNPEYRQECIEKQAKCRYNCANENSILEDCLKRCVIKYDYCISKN